MHFRSRVGDYLLLGACAALLSLPGLGSVTLWDIDEGNNAEASREMLTSGNWIVPTFNYQLRPDKPALLYWVQMAGYRLFGIGELAARLPSALAGMATVLLVYELARAMSGRPTGRWAGLVLATCVLFCAASRFANPDALLTCFTTLTLLLFWQSLSRPGRGWVIGAGASAGLAVLAKGPVGLLLPGLTALVFLAWTGRLRWLLARRVVLGLGLALLVALPWYVWVGAETHGDFLRGFLLSHNAGRYLRAMEGHRGGAWYYVAVLAVGLVPWSPFVGLAFWHGNRPGAEETGIGPGPEGRDAFRFLATWILVYVAFFSLAATKLPNYILPVYPAFAVLIGCFLDRWRQGTVSPAPWAVRTSFIAVALVGLVVIAGTLVASSQIELAAMRGRFLPGLARLAPLGLVLVVGSGVSWALAARRPRAAPVALILSAFLFLAPLAAIAGKAFETAKAPAALAETFRGERREPEVRLASLDYDQPSLVFYCRRQIQRLGNPVEAIELLRYPLPVYLFTPEPLWQTLAQHIPGRVLARQYDFYRHTYVVLVTNR